jgi:hypothetical protein
MSDRFTEKQGLYLAFIDSYMVMHGRAPAEANMTPHMIRNMIKHCRRYIESGRKHL